jgi:DNA-binding CsgD family transcriptional regulator
MVDSTSGVLGAPGPEEPVALTDLVGLFQAAEQVANLGSWEWRPRTDARLWSANLYRLLGFEPAAGIPSRASLIERVVPDDRPRAIRYANAARELAHPPPIELRFQDRKLGVRHLRVTATTCEADLDGPTRIVGVVQDVSDGHVTTQQIATLLIVSNTLAEWDRLAVGVVHLLGQIGRTLEFRCGTLWLPEGRMLVPTATWSEPAPELAALATATATLRCPPGTALPGRVWGSRRPATLVDVGDDELPRRRVAATEAGLRGAIAFPALHLGEVIAVLEFYHDQEPEPITQLLPTMVAIGGELGEFFSRRGGELGDQHLTERQLRVLTLAAAGNATPQIAAELGLSASTVRTHFDHIYEKLGVVGRAAAVARALRLGLIT